MNRDAIDFGTAPIGKLYRQMLLPTVASMLFSALFIVVDGIMVGKGIGSDALAAVNIVCPIWLLATGVGLMFGMGGSVVASIHLAEGNVKAARINITQSLLVSTLLVGAFSVVVIVFIYPFLRLLGCSQTLMALAYDYLLGFAPFLCANSLICSVGFVLRIDGSPRYAMVCSIVATLINMLCDYLFIFPLQMGTYGAALATAIGTMVGVVMAVVYLITPLAKLRFKRIKLTVTSLKLTLRNVFYQCRIGFSSFLGDVAVSVTMLCGNYVFMRLLGDSGVAAFSVACYIMPIAFMVCNAIAQSAQPIISYNYGASQFYRSQMAFRLALATAVAVAVLVVAVTPFSINAVVGWFIQSYDPAFSIATYGLPYYVLAFVPMSVNLLIICYLQSIKCDCAAAIITVLRGFVLLVLAFMLMPALFGIIGAWLSVAVTETFTLIVSVVLLRKALKNI